jgi:hypothetical protein
MDLTRAPGAYAPVTRAEVEEWYWQALGGVFGDLALSTPPPRILTHLLEMVDSALDVALAEAETTPGFLEFVDLDSLLVTNVPRLLKRLTDRCGEDPGIVRFFTEGCCDCEDFRDLIRALASGNCRFDVLELLVAVDAEGGLEEWAWEGKPVPPHVDDWLERRVAEQTGPSGAHWSFVPS